MWNTAENPTNTPQEYILEDISLTDIPEEYKSPDLLLWYIVTKLSHLYQAKKSNRIEFEDFLESKLEENTKTAMDIISFWVEDNQVIFQDATWSTIFSFSPEEFEEYILDSRYWWNRESIEKRVLDIQAAIKSVYDDNDWYFFDGEIDEQDKVKKGPYKWKSLLDLQELLKSDTQTLAEIYEITGKSQKKREMLRTQIEMLAWVGDLYEWGARVFSLSETELSTRVKDHISGMSIEDIFLEMIHFNEKINSNWRKSEMVRQVNLKLMNAFYIQTYERLIKEKSPNTIFIRFVEIITWRATIEKTANGRNGWKDRKINTRISFDNAMANYDIASKALLYVMHRPEGVLDTIIKEKQELAPWDPEVEDKSPQVIVEDFKTTLQSRNPEIEDFGNTTLIKSGFHFLIDLKESDYHKLSFEEKTAIWALYRITNILKAMGDGEIDPQALHNEIVKTSQDAFVALENDMNDTFDGKNLDLWIAHPNFFGYNSNDLWLTGEMAQIFDLYQDIHGNSWFFDLHDANKDWFQEPWNVVTLWVWIMAWVILIPIIAPWTVLAMAWTWALIWLATWISSTITSRQGYDTYDEAALDITSQLIYEVISSAAFMGAFWWFLKSAGMLNPNWKLRFDYDMLFSKEAWWKWWIIDKSFIVSEVIAWMFANKVIIDYVKSQFPENNFDTNTRKYSDIEKGSELQAKNSFSLNPENYWA